MTSDRRPIPARSSRPAVVAARWLAQAGVHPNQISILSVIFAAIGALAFVLSRDQEDGARIALLLAAGVSIPLRLLCNMLDGMVAVEHDKRTKSGDLYNELPDRISDVLLIVGAGYAVTEFGWAPALGWLGGTLAVLTAYVRALGGATGVGQDFSGPMAKQQRMAVLAAACVFTPVEVALGGRDYLLLAALLTIAIGSAVTVLLRTRSLVQRLEAR